MHPSRLKAITENLTEGVGLVLIDVVPVSVAIAVWFGLPAAVASCVVVVGGTSVAGR